MSITDDLRSTIQTKMDENVGRQPRLRVADVLGQRDGTFDIGFGTEVRSRVPQLRPFSGFTSGSRAKQVLVYYGETTEPLVVGTFEPSYDKNPKRLRRWSWMG